MLKALELWSQITGVQVTPNSKFAISLRMYIFWLPCLWSQDGSLLLSSFVRQAWHQVFSVSYLLGWDACLPGFPEGNTWHGGLTHLPKVTQLTNEVALASDLLNFTVLT